MAAKDKGAFINPQIKAFKAERKEQRDSGIDKLTKEFEIKIPVAMKHFQQIAALPACKADGRIMQDHMLRVFGVLPENITVLACLDDFNQIVNHVRLDGEELEETKN